MIQSLDFSSVTERNIVEIGRDILNRGFSLNLTNRFSWTSRGDEPDLIQYKKGSSSKLDIIAEVYGRRVFKNEDILKLKARIHHYSKENPNEIIILFLREQQELIKNLTLDFGDLSSLRVLDLSWIKSFGDEDRDVFEKWNLIESPNNTDILSELRTEKVSKKKRSFYVGGHTWGNDSQLSRFLTEGIWENGWDDKFTKVVNSVISGDLLFLKATVRKGNQGLLKLRAVGVVIANPRDGKKLYVNWFTFPKEITSRKGSHLQNAIQIIGVDFIDDILNTVLLEHPDLPNIIDSLREDSVNLSQVTEAQSSAGIEQNTRDLNIQKLIQSSTQFWWLQARIDRWNIDKMMLGDSVPYGKFDSSGKIQRYFNELTIGDAVIGYQAGEKRIKGIFEIEGKDEEAVQFRLYHKFEQQTTLEELRSIDDFRHHAINTSRVGSFHKLEEDLFFQILNTTELKDSSEREQVNKSRIANIAHDVADGTDFLGIDKDVTAFAKIIASNNFSPPLAIALFGQWGTGKSFFMRKLWEKIENYSRLDSPLYDTGIAQIHFNAWSYMDANLWASIVTRIFDGLHNYISGDSRAKDKIQEIQEELNHRLTLLKEERDHFQSHIERNKCKVEELEERKNTLNEEIEGKLDKIRKTSIKSLLEGVNKEFKIIDKLQAAFGQNLAPLKKVVPETYWKDPDAAFQKAKSGYTFIKNWLSFRNVFINLTFLVLAIVMYLTIPELLENVGEIGSNLIQLLAPVLATVAPLWSTITRTHKKMTSIIHSFLSVKKQYQTEVDSALYKHEQLKDTLRIEIDQMHKESELLEDQMLALNNEIQDLQFKLDHSPSTQTLYSFIERRAKGDTYKKHLGLISTIRNDFEVLSELFDQSKKESENKRFQEHFNRPLQRIVLYIDDLDRCPEARVIQVLEAVNLIMAFPLFVVVVGVDPRWVKNALIKEYNMQFSSSENPELTPIDASNYLEKIFQIPFHLEEAEDKSVKAMLKELSTTAESHDDLVEVSSNDDEKANEQEEEMDKEDEYSTDNIDFHISDSLVIEEEHPKDELLSLSDQEVSLIQEMSGIIGTNPRAIKRFINVYQVVRAHEGLGLKKNESRDFLAIMFLLALPMGKFKTIHPYFISYLNDYQHEEKELALFIQGSFSIAKVNDPPNDEELTKKLNELKSELDIYLSDKTEFQTLQSITMIEFQQYNEFVQRFTFAYA